MASFPASALIEVASPALFDRLLGCPLRVAFEQAGSRGGGQRARPTPWALVGDAIHRTIELCFQNPPAELEDAWDQACDEMAARDRDPRSAPSARRSYLRLQRRLPDLRAYIEGRDPASILCEQTITSPDGQVIGRIDLLVLGAHPSVIDHKTGVVFDDGSTSAHIQRQLAIYAWLVGAALQIDLEEAVIFSLRDGLVEVDVSEPTRRPLVEAAFDALAAYNDLAPGEQPATPSEEVCGTCRFVGRCDPAWESLADGKVERLGWGEAIRGVVAAPVVIAAGNRGALQMDVGEGTVAGAVVVIDIPAELVSGLDVGNELATWGLALRSDDPVTLAWRDGSSAIELSP
jgi:hypothetical protein